MKYETAMAAAAAAVQLRLEATLGESLAEDSLDAARKLTEDKSDAALLRVKELLEEAHDAAEGAESLASQAISASREALTLARRADDTASLTAATEAVEAAVVASRSARRAWALAAELGELVPWEPNPEDVEAVAEQALGFVLSRVETMPGTDAQREAFMRAVTKELGPGPERRWAVAARAHHRETGEPIPGTRIEVVDTDNELFTSCQTEDEVRARYEAFWNDLNPRSAEVVEVLAVTRV